MCSLGFPVGQAILELMEISLPLLPPPPLQAGIEGMYHYHLAHVFYLFEIHLLLRVCTCMAVCVEVRGQPGPYGLWRLESDLQA